jgi:hypothetical protein
MSDSRPRTRAVHRRHHVRPRRGGCRVPIEHVAGAVTVPVHAEIEETPRPPVPEWRTDAWKHRVEAEALHRLEDGLRGLGSVD